MFLLNVSLLLIFLKVYLKLLIFHKHLLNAHPKQEDLLLQFLQISKDGYNIFLVTLKCSSIVFSKHHYPQLNFIFFDNFY